MNDEIAVALRTVGHGSALTTKEAEAFMNGLMNGAATPVQTAGLLAAMAVRGETVAEIVGFARGMRAHAIAMESPRGTVDTCGTGGDGSDSFNISTAAAIVTAAAGVPVAKHGNRAASSRSGSADVLTALGARIDLGAAAAAQCLRQTNLCFLFAQNFHPAMKYAAEPRKQLGFRTIFNILGPLTNPAAASRQVIGVYEPGLVEKMAQSLLLLGAEHALVVHGAGGLDELSTAGDTLVAEVRDGSVTTYTVHPTDFGLTEVHPQAVAGGEPTENADIIRRVLAGEQGARRDIVTLNAGAALYVAGRAPTIASGVRLAGQQIDNGSALCTLRAFVDATWHTTQLQPTEVAQ